jgi:uncharacterized alkaline shock family protein YloU
MSDPHVIEEPGGTITVPADALEEIVARAAEPQGVRPRRRRLQVTVRDGSAAVRIEVTARQGDVLPEVGRGVQDAVAEALVTMCGLAVESVDLSVEDLE